MRQETGVSQSDPGTETTFEVVSPLGRVIRESVDPAPSIENLDDKVVAFIWDYLFRGPEMFEILEDGLRQRFPRARFVDYTVFGNIHGADPNEKANLEAIAGHLEKNDVDVAIVAVGA
jgi:hypothetical protein